MPALGDEFRSAREARGLSLSDVAEQIHIRSVYLGAIESEDWSAIGAPVYVRGFIRTYARFLGLNGEKAVQEFNDAVPAEKPAAAAAVSVLDDREPTGPSVWAILGTAIAVALVAFVAYEWFLFSKSGGGARPPVAARATPVAAQPSEAPGGSPAKAASTAPSAAAKTSPSPPAHSLAVRLTQSSWLRVVVDGKNVAEGVFPAGTARTFSGSVVDLRVGNAGGVQISVNGSPPKTLGGTGDVVEQRYTL